jgi:3-dehydroquinate synthetase
MLLVIVTNEGLSHFFHQNKTNLPTNGFLMIENTLGYGVYLHGEAVAVGMLMAAKLSALEGFITDKEVQQIEYLLQKVNLPITISILTHIWIH